MPPACYPAILRLSTPEACVPISELRVAWPLSNRVENVPEEIEYTDSRGAPRPRALSRPRESGKSLPVNPDQSSLRKSLHPIQHDCSAFRKRTRMPFHLHQEEKRCGSH